MFFFKERNDVLRETLCAFIPFFTMAELTHTKGWSVSRN
jgi:hypothetical protein